MDFHIKQDDNKATKALTGAISFPVVGAAIIGSPYDEILTNREVTEDNPGFAVVELFTSEGCDSCPPADVLVEKIQGNDKTRQVYILAFHVDYWDHHGWKDRFSASEYTRRQEMYAEWLHVNSMYTPQIVVNGTTEHVGSNAREVLKAISAGLAMETKTKLTLTGKIEDGQVTLDYQATGDEKTSEIVVALIQKSAESNVTAGENVGRSLYHVQVVRRMVRMTIEGNRKNIPAIALPDDFDSHAWEIIGFIQNKSNGRIAAAARIDLKK